METPVNAQNIQGDILAGGFAKKTETFIFFQITDGKKFIQDLVKLAPLITTVEQTMKNRDAIAEHKKEKKSGLIKMSAVNISLSYTGLHTMGIPDEKLKGTALMLNDKDLLFKKGAAADAPSLNDPTLPGDPTKPNWEPEFLGRIDGVILVAADSHDTVKEKVKEVEKVFDHGHHQSSIKVMKSIVGDVRPKEQHGHEHFGFQDGVSNPLIAGFDPVVPGPAPIDAKFILTGHEDTTQDWTTDGSLLVFRYLFQQVPEFDKFLKDNAVKKDPLTGKDMSTEQGSELLGARLVGRWKSGAPVDIAPLRDDKELANDPNRVNNFNFMGEFTNNNRCPWAGHIRRTNPRADSTRVGPNAIDNRRIIRRGIPFGPEVTTEEHASSQSKHDRGLLFVCYQSSINNAFRFIQISWSNNPQFPFVLPTDPAPGHVPGFDTLIGQPPAGVARQMTGYDPNTANDPNQKPLNMPVFINARGGGYFFSPSLKSLKTFGSLVSPAPAAPATTA